jgi:molybdate transport system permease protein
MEWNAIFLTFRLALVVCAVLLALGIPIAYWIAFSHWRWKFLIEAVVALPLVLPPTVLGFYILVAMGSNSPVGRLYQSLFGHALPFTFTSLAIASVIYSLPFAVQPMAAAFSQVDRDLIGASAILGASRLRTFWRIILPLSRGGIVTGAVLSFAHTLGEFGVVLMVGGNIPGVTRTVSIAIYDHVEALDYHGANQMALLLLVFSFITLSLTYGVNRRIWAVWPGQREPVGAPVQAPL